MQRRHQQGSRGSRWIVDGDHNRPAEAASARITAEGSRSMRRLVIIGVTLGIALIACGSSSSQDSAAQAALQKAADTQAINQIEVNWHKASSTKDLDLMMSLWADNATFTVGTQTYTGKAEIRTFFATKAGPFRPENVWISETPAYKLRITVDGDNGTLYFECHYVDAASRQVKSLVGANLTVARIAGRWQITSSRSATVILSP